MNQDVLLCNELANNALQELLNPYQIKIVWVDVGEQLPGSFWGDPEAGLIGSEDRKSVV